MQNPNARQSAAHIFMVRPARFGFNSETALSNAFQSQPETAPPSAARLARDEFDGMVGALREKGVGVLVLEDTASPAKPDAVFPNNWLSLHADGTAFLYPMQAENRRAERRQELLEAIGARFRIGRVVDLSRYEAEGRFLEGTGSVVFDHLSQTAFACLSARTDESVLRALCAAIGYRPVGFRALDREGRAIYHTNVMMAVGSRFAVVCLESMPDASERERVVAALEGAGREIVEITFEQMSAFAGNMLELEGKDGKKLLVLSQTAMDRLEAHQTQALRKHCELVPIGIPTIEKIGGGSVRCMMGEIFSPKKS